MIQRLTKKNRSRTLLHAEVGNELIDFLNNMEANSEVIPNTAGTVSVKQGRLVIDLTPIADRINALNQQLGSPLIPL